MAKRGKSSKQKKLKRMNSRKVSYKRKGKRITQKIRGKNMRGGASLPAIVHNKQHDGAFFYDFRLDRNSKLVQKDPPYNTISNMTSVGVLSKPEYNKFFGIGDVSSFIGPLGKKGNHYQVVRLIVGHDKVYGGYIYGLVGSDHLEYAPLEPEPAPAPVVDIEQIIKRVSSLLRSGEYGKSIELIQSII